MTHPTTKPNKCVRGGCDRPSATDSAYCLAHRLGPKPEPKGRPGACAITTPTSTSNKWWPFGRKPVDATQASVAPPPLPTDADSAHGERPHTVDGHALPSVEQVYGPSLNVSVGVFEQALHAAYRQLTGLPLIVAYATRVARRPRALVITVDSSYDLPRLVLSVGDAHSTHSEQTLAWSREVGTVFARELGVPLLSATPKPKRRRGDKRA
jgi:hypothetical protein